MTNYFLSILTACTLFILPQIQAQHQPHIGPSVDLGQGRLVVSENGRFLQFENGLPFFYLGETAWELFHRLSMEEIEGFLENRRQKGFTVIQAVILAELDGLKTPALNGEVPLINMDPGQANEAYFHFVDEVVELAASKGLFMGLLPTWGDKVELRWGEGPVVFDDEKAFAYGTFLGDRYKNHPNIIWINGGDRACLGVEKVWDALARGIKSEDPNHLMTFHPMGGRSSSECFHEAPWLDFNMHQSGHGDRFTPNYRVVAHDYGLSPPKPCMDGEAIYEDHPFSWDPKNGIATEDDVRRAAYWSVFSGAHGHTYGNHCIWQFYSDKVEPVNHPPMSWMEAMDRPGAFQMLHLRRLMESRPMLSRVPDQSLIWGNSGESIMHIAATRGDGYAMVYLPANRSVTLDFNRFSGNSFRCWWFNPRTGVSEKARDVEGNPREHFLVPVAGVDWVLVIDEKKRDFHAPGNSK